MTDLPSRSKRWSIARQIGLLIMVALFSLTAANFLVTFAGPPPRPAPLADSDIVPLLRGEAEPLGPADNQLTIEEHATFLARDGERRDVESEFGMAKALGVETSRVRIARDDHPPRANPGIFMGNFSIGLEEKTGHWRIVRSKPQPLVTAWHRTTIAITLGLTALLGLVAILVTRSITHPLRRLARETDETYVDGRASPITVGGPPEIAHLASSIAIMRDRFAQLIQSRTMMLAAIAHDMATPLARLEFHVAKLPAARRAQAEADLEELSDLIASILAYAKGQQGLDRRPVSLAGVALQMVQRYNQPKAPVTLQAIEDELWVMGDRLALQRLLGNLIGNAQRYAGGCAVALSASDGMAVLSIIDEGPGFPPDLAEKLFEPFFRIEGSRSRQTAGAGLGLATARAIAEAHDGTLVAAGCKGVGATFTLRIPLATALHSKRDRPLHT